MPVLKLDSEAQKTLGNPDGKGIFAVSARLSLTGDGEYRILSINGHPAKYPESEEDSEPEGPDAQEMDMQGPDMQGLGGPGGPQPQQDPLNKGSAGITKEIYS